MSPISRLLSVFVVVALLLSQGESRTFHHLTGEDNYLTREEHWINQTIDHFSPTANQMLTRRRTPILKIWGTVAPSEDIQIKGYIKRWSYTFYNFPNRKELALDILYSGYILKEHHQFKQRYYEFHDYFKAPHGPIFFKLCGESACNGIVNDYTAVLAKKFDAALVSLEHRYYGKSNPFESLTTENLRYLSSKQALFDLAYFRQYYQETLNAKYNLSNTENSWFIFGVSYSGALSAWFRLKFPHLTCGSLASSAVVLTIFNFTEFDKQVGVSAGPECKGVLQEATKLVEERLLSDGKAVKSLFGAASLKNDVDFLYLLADAAVVAFQYGNPDILCKPLVDAKITGKNLLETYASYVKDYYLGSFGSSVQTYDQENLKNVTINENSGNRLWWFQVCTEVAYFQVAPSNDSVRSSRIDSQYHLDLCKNVFGEALYPEVDMTNLYYGGTKIAGSKIVFTNGSQDPWRHASKQKSTENLPSYIIDCHNCGHGTDLRGCPQSPLSIKGDAGNCTSPEAVEKVRQQVTKHIDLWLSECQTTGSDVDGRRMFTM